MPAVFEFLVLQRYSVVVRATLRNIQLIECINEFRWRLSVWLFIDTPAIASTLRDVCGTLDDVKVSVYSSNTVLAL